MSLYLFDKRTDIDAPIDRDGGFPFAETLCVYVDKQDLAGDQNTLGHYTTSKDGHPIEVCGRFSEPTVRALSTFLDLANRPHVCQLNSEKKDVVKSTRRGGSRPSSPDEAEEGEDDAREEDPIARAMGVVSDKFVPNDTKVYLAKPANGQGSSVPMNRCEVYVETVYGRDEREAAAVEEYRNYVEWMAEYGSTEGMEEAAHERGLAFRDSPPEDPKEEYEAYARWLASDQRAFPESTAAERDERATHAKPGDWFLPPRTVRDGFRTEPPTRTERGHRFWFFMYDQSLSWDAGILAQTRENASRSAKKKPLAFWQWAQSQDEWITGGVSPYRDFCFSTERVNDEVQVKAMRNAFHYSICDAESPARAWVNFTFERSNEMIAAGGEASAAQTYVELYARDGKFLSFPRGARHVPITLRSPSFMLNAQLEMPPYVDPKTNSRDGECRMYMMADKTNDALHDLDVMTGLVASAFEADIGGDHAKRSQPVFVERFTGWVSGAYAPPGISAAWAFLREKVGKPVVPDDTVCWDDTLSEFGNSMVGFMMMLEQVFDVAYLHDEILFDMINSLGAFRNAAELRLHVLKLGPPASGKSYIQEVLQRVMVPGTFVKMSHQTKQANTTSTNRDCMVMFMDEAPELLSDKGSDGTGPSQMKEIMTNGATYTEQCVIKEDTRERVSMETKARRLIQYNIASNAARSKIHDSLISRFFIRAVPLRSCDGQLDPALEKMIGSKEDKVLMATIDRLQTIFALTAMVTHGIDMKWLMKPEMGFGIGLVEKFFQNLTTVKPDTRTKERVPLYIRPALILHAVCSVFNTNKHFAPGTNFEMKHLVECERYLRASREIVYFSISHMRDAFVDVNAMHVYAAIKNLVEKQKGRKHPPIDLETLIKREDAFAKEGKAAKYTPEDMTSLRTTLTGAKEKTTADDKRRLLLGAPYLGTDSYALTCAAVNLITAEIGTGTDVRFSREMVTDILNWMTSQGVDSFGQPVVSVSVAGKYEEYGVAFSDEFIKVDTRNVVQNAIRETFDAHVPAGTRYVLGITYREGIPDGELPSVKTSRKRMFPHVFQVMEKRGTEGTEQMFRNHAYKGFGYRAFVPRNLRGELDSVAAKPFKRIDADYDALLNERHLQSLGLTSIPEGEMLNEAGERYKWTGMGQYPESYIEDHLRGFDTELCDTVSSEFGLTTTTTTTKRARLEVAAPARVEEEEVSFTT